MSFLVKQAFSRSLGTAQGDTRYVRLSGVEAPLVLKMTNPTGFKNLSGLLCVKNLKKTKLFFPLNSPQKFLGCFSFQR